MSISIETPSNVEDLLNNVRTLLDELGNRVTELANAHPDIFDDVALKSSVEGFREAYREAAERLEHPTLSIATLGTTSSGKSTIVNALIGRRVAPIERSEMSGGVLKFRASDRSQLIIEETPNAQWETGEWTGLSDEELYDRIQKVMLSYHEVRRREADCLAPQITVKGALLPAIDRTLLNLPPGIDLEFIDLPGLKSVQDRSNLEVIQPQVHKSCSVVALDYAQVDEEHRQRLLKELQEVVTFLNGRTDSMIFVLNRVDLRGSDDFPLETQLEKLKQEIQSVLSLEHTPEVIPFNAQLLYYAQCAWGTNGGYTDSQIEPQKRLDLLRKIFKDCASIIAEKTEDDEKLENWFHNLRRQVRKEKEVDDETMRIVLFYALKWSGGEQLWNTLRYRLKESFPQLVILPAIQPALRAFDALLTKIGQVAETRRIEKKEQVEAQLENLNVERKTLEREISKSKQGFERFINDVQRDLEENTSESRDRAINKAQKKGIGLNEFKVLRSVVDALRDDLNFKLIVPVEESFDSKISAYDLQDRLKEIISPVIAEDIARAFDRVKNSLSIFTRDRKTGCFVAKVEIKDKRKISELEETEAAYLKLYKVMGYALSKRAEFVLQGQVNRIKEALVNFAEGECNQIIELVTEEFVDFALRDALEAEFKLIVDMNPPQIPDNFFEMIPSIQVSTETQREKVGTKRVEYEVKHSFLFFFKWTEKKYRNDPVYKDFEYRELQLPDFIKMASQWRDDIQTQESELWAKIGQWIISYLDLIRDRFSEANHQVLDLTDRSLQQQKRIIEQNFSEEKKRWQKLESHRHSLLTIRKQFQDLLS